jgi:carbamoylphosphate synthase large subunit
VAAKLAVGYTLDELMNDITGGRTPASFDRPSTTLSPKSHASTLKNSLAPTTV